MWRVVFVHAVGKVSVGGSALVQLDVNCVVHASCFVQAVVPHVKMLQHCYLVFGEEAEVGVGA